MEFHNSTPNMSEKMAEATVNGSYKVFDNEAHMMAYISPRKINPVINAFINNL